MSKRKPAKRRKRIKVSAEEMESCRRRQNALPKAEIILKQILKSPTGKVSGNRAIEVLLADREGR